MILNVPKGCLERQDLIFREKATWNSKLITAFFAMEFLFSSHKDFDIILSSLIKSEVLSNFLNISILVSNLYIREFPKSQLIEASTFLANEKKLKKH